MVDKVALGRQGEIFVMRKLLENGWNFPKKYNQTMEGLDWVFEKNGRIIKVQVKTCLNEYITYSVNNKNFDYLIITNLKTLWIIPKIIFYNTNRLTKTFKRLQEKYLVLDLEGYFLVNTLNDYKIPYNSMNKAVLSQISQEMKVHPYFSTFA